MPGSLSELPVAQGTGTTPPPLPDKQFITESGLALTVYVLYLAGFATGITALIGVVVAHIARRSASEVPAAHFRFQIRTFWIGLLYLIVGWPLSYALVGIPILIWWFIWTLIRVIKGILILNNGEPISRPGS